MSVTDIVLLYYWKKKEKKIYTYERKNIYLYILAFHVKPTLAYTSSLDSYIARVVDVYVKNYNLGLAKIYNRR